MSKSIAIDLIFNANTTQAKSQMKSLQTGLQQLQQSMLSGTSLSGFNSSIQESVSQINTLRANLSSAFNVNTGKLDLHKFNNNLKNSGQNLTQIRKQLESLGPVGQQQFRQLAKTIQQGETPLQKTNTALSGMMNTLTNTLKWTLASSLIRGVSSAFQEAFHHVEALNTSLTNIRVVTGKSKDVMDKFAASANKAAKVLSTTTTAYTDAALIYYQQGLDGKAVEERAETTLKLANVTGQSAQEVSNQMTAIWNNFYDGSKSLEYYADVITALGAATASSSEEIAQGLEKFMAVAETVGLSYEYATAALATVTAETRQSADVVGTAFKTLFARIQDLELGNALDDGTTLGQYSEALLKVGINIKDSNGELKSMNVILDEMGEKWNSLNKDQQVALAQNVAGVRQYTQLVALMENYDTFKVNLEVADNSSGELEKQQEVWADSWIGAKKRVQASQEELYQSLIDDEFFINLNNGFADVISGVTKFIDAIGGLKTIIPALSGMLLSVFGPKLIAGITNFTNGIQIAKNSALQSAILIREESMKNMDIMNSNLDKNSGYANQPIDEAELKILKSIEFTKKELTTKDIEALQNSMKRLENEREILNSLAQQADEKEELARLANEQLKVAETESNRNDQSTMNSELMLKELAKTDEQKKAVEMAANRRTQAKVGQQQINAFVQNDIDYSNSNTASMQAKGMVDNLLQQDSIRSKLETMGQLDFVNNFDGTKEQLEVIKRILGEIDLNADAAEQNAKELSQAFASVDPTSLEKANNEFNKVAGSFNETGMSNQNKTTDWGTDKTNIQNMRADANTMIDMIDSGKINGASDALEQLKTKLEAFKNSPSQKTFNKVQQALNGIKTQGAQASTSVKNFGENSKRAASVIEKYTNETKEATSVSRNLINAQRNNNTATKDSENAYKNFNTALDKSKLKISDIVNESTKLTKVPLGQTIVSLSSSFAMMASAMNTIMSSFKSMGELFKKENTSFSDWLPVISSLLFTIPMLAGAFKGLNTVLGLSNVLIGVNKINTERLTAAKAAEILTEALGIKVTKESNLATSKGIALKAKTITLALALKAAKLLEALGINMAATADKAYAVAAGEASVASWALLWPILAVTAAIAALVAVVVLFVKAANKVNYNTWEKRAEADAKAADKLADAYTNAKEKYEKLVETIDKYTEARNGLDDLIKGTKEYNDALKNSNDLALELINLYGLTKGIDYDWVDGQLVITNKTLDDIKEKEEQDIQTAYSASTIRGAKAKVSAAGSYKENVIEEAKKSGYFDSYIITPTDQGPLYSTLAGGEIEFLEKAFDLFKQDPELFKEENEELLKKSLGKTVLGYEDINEIVKGIRYYADHIKRYYDQLEASNEAQKTAAEVIANSIIEASDTLNASEWSEEILKTSGQIYDQVFDKNFDLYYEQAQSRKGNKKHLATDESSELFWEWAEEQGYTKEFGFKVTNYTSTKDGKEGSVQFKYMQNGEWVEGQEVSSTELAAWKAAQVSGEEALKNFEELNAILNSLDFGDNETLKSAVIKFATSKNLNDLTQEEFTVLQTALNSGFNFEQYLAKLINGEGTTALTEHQRELFGLTEGDNIDSIYESGAQSIGAMQIDQSVLDFDKDFTYDTILDLNNVFKNISTGIHGEYAGQQFLDGLNKMLEGVNEEQYQEVLNQLLSINWSEYDSFDQAIALLENYGVTLNTTDDQWKNFINTLRTAQMSMPDFSSMIIQLKEVSKIIKDLKSGGIISQDLYNSLLQLNPDFVENHFIETSEGMQFYGTEQDQAKLFELSTQNLQNYGQNIIKNIEEFNKSNNSGLSTTVKMGKTSLRVTAQGLLQTTEANNVLAYQLAGLASETNKNENFYEILFGKDGKGQGLLGNITAEEFYSYFNNFVSDPNALHKYTEEESAYMLNIAKIIGEYLSGNYQYTQEDIDKEISKNAALYITDYESYLNYGQYLTDEAKQVMASQVEKWKKEYLDDNFVDFENYDIDVQNALLDEQKRIEELQKEKDTHWDINRELELEQRNLEQIEKQIERAYGTEKLNLFNQAVKSNQKQLEISERNLNQYLEEIKANKKALDDAGADFFDNGELNYDKTRDKFIQEYQNKMVSGDYAILLQKEADAKSYLDTLKADENSTKAQISAQEKAVEKATEDAEKFKEEADKTLNDKLALLESYETLDQAANDTRSSIEELKDAISELALEKIEIEFELKADVRNLKNEFIELQKSLIDNPYEDFGLSKTLNLTQLQAENTLASINDLQQEYHEVMTNPDITPEKRAVKIQEIMSNMKDDIESLIEIDNEMKEAYGNALDNAAELYNELYEGLDKASEKIEHFLNLAKLTGKEFDFKYLDKILNAQLDVSLNTLNNKKIEMDRYSLEYATINKEYQQALNTPGWSEEDLKMKEEKLKEAEARMLESQNIWLSELENVAELAKEVYENSMEDIKKAFEKAVYGTSLDDYMSSLEKLSKSQEGYLTTTNKLYETNKLIRQAQQSMDKTENNQAKLRYNGYVTYLKQLQQSGNLSEYELSIAEAKFKLLQEQIALEEAQGAKNQVRLQRDSEGNFGYVYTANQDAINDAEQKVADAENNLYNIGLSGVQDYSSEYASLTQEMYEDLDSLRERYYNGELTESEYMALVEQAKEFYYNKLQQIQGNYYLATDIMQQTSHQNQIDYLAKDLISLDDFKQNVENYLLDSEKAYEDYSVIMNTVGANVKEVFGEISSAAQGAALQTNNIYNAIKQLDKDIAIELENVRKRTSAWSTWYGVMKNVLETYEGLNNMSIKTLEADGSAAPYLQEKNEQAGVKTVGYGHYYEQYLANSGPGSTLNSEEYKNASLYINRLGGKDADWTGDVVTDWSAEITKYVSDSKKIGASEKAVITQMAAERDKKIKKEGLESKVTSTKDLLKSLGVSLDTGGYTGAWGPEGRWAMLHQKEIVLNAHDTENFLSAIEILRGITQAIDLQAMSFGNMFTSTLPYLQNTSSTLQQDVTIHAEFPNATDHNEIQLAIEGLVNSASQYANRK